MMRFQTAISGSNSAKRKLCCQKQDNAILRIVCVRSRCRRQHSMNRERIWGKRNRVHIRNVWIFFFVNIRRRYLLGFEVVLAGECGSVIACAMFSFFFWGDCKKIVWNIQNCHVDNNYTLYSSVWFIQIQIDTIHYHYFVFYYFWNR